MYLEYYNFREMPFSITCDERFFYESAVHAEALANMVYTVQGRKGMVLITGEVGAGKTFAGSMLGSRLGMGCTTVTLKNPPPSPKQLFRGLAMRLGLAPSPRADKLALTDELEHHLQRERDRGHLVALILDEAQDLPPVCMEEIRLLWNWECDGQRLLQIILMGQPELRQTLQAPRWEPLRQRIVLSYHLGRLTPADTGAYIAHRLRIASRGQGKAEFTAEAVEDIHAATHGTPRLINVLCDNALLIGYARGTRCMDRAVVGEVVRDMTCWGMRACSSLGAARPQLASIHSSNSWQMFGTR